MQWAAVSTLLGPTRVPVPMKFFAAPSAGSRKTISSLQTCRNGSTRVFVTRLRSSVGPRTVYSAPADRSSHSRRCPGAASYSSSYSRWLMALPPSWSGPGETAAEALPGRLPDVPDRLERARGRMLERRDAADEAVDVAVVLEPVEHVVDASPVGPQPAERLAPDVPDRRRPALETGFAGAPDPVRERPRLAAERPRLVGGGERLEFRPTHDAVDATKHPLDGHLRRGLRHAPSSSDGPRHAPLTPTGSAPSRALRCQPPRGRPEGAPPTGAHARWIAARHPGTSRS